MDRPDTREALGAEARLDHAQLFQSMSKAARRVEMSLFDAPGAAISAPAPGEAAVATVFLKQLNLLEGGIGCALWDAAIILARVLWANVDVSGAGAPSRRRWLTRGHSFGLNGCSPTRAGCVARSERAK